MKRKSINIMWLLYSILVVLFVVISFFDCCEGNFWLTLTSELGVGEEGYTTGENNFAPIMLVLGFAEILFFIKKKTVMNVLGIAISCFAAILTTAATFVHELSCSITARIGDPIGTFSFTEIGYIAITLAWIIVVSSVCLTIGYVKERKS